MTPKNIYEDLPKNLTFDKGSKRYRYRWPPTGKRTWLGSNKNEAIEKAKRLNVAAKLERDARVLNHVEPVFSEIIDSYIELQVPSMAWTDSTELNRLAQLNLYKKQLGRLTLSQVDRLVIAKWIEKRCKTGDSKRKHRLNFVRLYDFAISRKWCDFNEAQAIPKYSRSMKLVENKITRKRMSLDQFWRIHDVSPLYIQVAMQMSLVTLQARNEVINMQRSDIRDGHIYVIRKKTASESDSAFIRIPINTEIERILSMSRSSGIVSPFIVHRLRKSIQPTNKTKAPHPTWISPAQFSSNFAYQRDKAGVTEEYKQGEAPSFHEIRSLGARLMEESGVDKNQIKLLLAHGDQKTSDIYLDGRDMVRDDAYITVNASLIIK